MAGNSKLIHLLHNSEHPTSVFSILDTGTKHIPLVADSLFDLLILKMQPAYTSKKQTKVRKIGRLSLDHIPNNGKHTRENNCDSLRKWSGTWYQSHFIASSQLFFGVCVCVRLNMKFMLCLKNHAIYKHIFVYLIRSFSYSFEFSWFPFLHFTTHINNVFCRLNRKGPVLSLAISLSSLAAWRWARHSKAFWLRWVQHLCTNRHLNTFSRIGISNKLQNNFKTFCASNQKKRFFHFIRRLNIDHVWYHQIAGIYCVNLCKVLWVPTYHRKFHRILRLNRNRHLSHIPNRMMSINPWIRFNSIWSILAIIANKRTHLWPLHALKHTSTDLQFIPLTNTHPQPHPHQRRRYFNSNLA